MPKVPQFYYAVRVGRKPGIYTTWEDCHEQVNRYGRAVFKKLRTLDEAEDWMNSSAGGLPASGPVGQRDTPHATRSGLTKPHNQTRVASVGPSPPANASYSSPATSPTPIAGSGSGSSTSARAGPSTLTGSSSSTAFEDVVYTDGACSRNGQAGSVGGIGVWWGPNDPRNLAERCPGSPQTNNRAELIAIIRALETAPTTPIPLVIKTDSEYAMTCIKGWLPGWRKKNFRTSQGTRVKNSELIMYADALMTMRRQAGQEVRFEHVRGHAGEAGNEGADALAVRGSKLQGKVDSRDWDELRLQLETQKAVDASMFADMLLDEEQLVAELEGS